MIKIVAFCPEVDGVRLRINKDFCRGITLPASKGKRLK